MLAYVKRVLLKMLAINYLKHSASLRTDNRISAKSVEMNARGKRLRDLGLGYDRGKRYTVANALRHRDDIRNYTLRFKSPIVRSGPSKTRLNFVRDAHAAHCAHVLISDFQIAIRKNYRSTDSLN